MRPLHSPLPILLAVWILLTITSCQRRIYEQSVQRDTVMQTRTLLIHDTLLSRHGEYVVIHDSIAPRLDSLQRVIGIDRWHYRITRLTDTLETHRLIHHTDTLLRTRRVEVHIRERQPTSTPIRWWIVATLLALAGILYAAWRWCRWRIW